MTKTIRRELRFSQSPEAVWRALTDNAALAEWMYPNDFEPRVGHRFTFRVPPNPRLEAGLVVRCEVLECVPPRALAFTWVVDEFLDTRVSYCLEPDGTGTRVLFEHTGFEQEPALRGAEYGWTTMHGKLPVWAARFNELDKVVENCNDRRRSMDARRENEPAPMKNRTTVEQTSERELVVTRTFNAPAHIVFEAWTKPELFKRWWVPKSIGVSLLSCELDVRVGGGYRLVFSHPAASEPMPFFGTYREVAPHSRLVWTNDEGGEAGQITTVTFEEKAGKTLVILHELYPSKEALDGALASGSGVDALPEAFEQLDELLVSLGARV
jgi:uncharacterized protein YndB with AHSA1/START domain